MDATEILLFVWALGATAAAIWYRGEYLLERDTVAIGKMEVTWYTAAIRRIARKRADERQLLIPFSSDVSNTE